MSVSWFKRHDVARSASEYAEKPIFPTQPPPMRPQQLGPNQLKWLEDRFRFYGIHRKQAEAPTGVAVVQSSSLPSEAEAS